MDAAQPTSFQGSTHPLKLAFSGSHELRLVWQVIYTDILTPAWCMHSRCASLSHAGHHTFMSKGSNTKHRTLDGGSRTVGFGGLSPEGLRALCQETSFKTETTAVKALVTET